MKRILAWFLALIMVFGMVSLPKMTKAEGELPELPEHSAEGDQPAEQPAEEEPVLLRGEEEAPAEEPAAEPEAKGEEPEAEPEAKEEEPEAPAAKEEEPEAPAAKSSTNMGSFTLYIDTLDQDTFYDTQELETSLTGATWSSSNDAVATVDQAGVVTAVSKGKDVRITAADADGNEEYWTVTVVHSVWMGNKEMTLNWTATEAWPYGDQEQLTSSITNPTWASQNPAVATVTDSGLVTALDTGRDIFITATAEDGITAEYWCLYISRYVPVESVTLNYTELTLNVNQYKYLKPIYTPENAPLDGANYVWGTYTSSDPKVAYMDRGNVYAKKAGTATITFTTYDGKTATCEVTVIERRVESLAFTNANDICKDLMWVGRNAELKLKLYPYDPNLSTGYLVNHIVNFTVDNPDVIKVTKTANVSTSAKFLVEPLNPGTATLTVTAQDTTNNPEPVSLTFKVVDPEGFEISMIPTIKYVGKSQSWSQQFNAYVIYGGGTRGRITRLLQLERTSGTCANFSSSSSSQQTGNYNFTSTSSTGTAKFTASIPATDTTATYTVNVVTNPNAYITGVEITPDNPVIYYDQNPTTTLTATFTPSTATNGRVVSWTSSNPDVTVTADRNNPNVATVSTTLREPGQAIIKATTQEGYNDSVTVTIDHSPTEAQWTIKGGVLTIGTGLDTTGVDYSGTIDMTHRYNNNGGTGVPKVPYKQYENVITSVVIANAIAPMYMDYWFSLKNANSFAGLDKIDGTNLVSVGSLFYNNTALTSGTLASLADLDTRNVKEFYEMFSHCKGLTTVEFSWLDTSSAEDFSSLLEDCTNLTSADVSALNTAGVYEFSCMFWGCESLTTITGLDKLNTGNVESTFRMFEDCKVLPALDLSNFDTSSVTDMRYMFKNCDALTTLDLSSFDTRNVTQMNQMFYSCDTLQTIIVSDSWVTPSSNTTSMFKNSTALVGGAGTLYDENHVDGEYARIDGGAAKPGYFTGKATPVAGYAFPKGVSASFNDSIKLNFYIDYKEDGAVAAMPAGVKAVATYMYGATEKTVEFELDDVEYVETPGDATKTGYKLSVSLVAKQVEDVVTIKLYDANDNPFPFKNASGSSDFTESGINFSLLQYLNLMLNDDEWKELGQAAKDYFYAAAQNFDYDVPSGTYPISSNINAVTVDTLVDYKPQLQGSVTGVTPGNITAMFETDNSFRFYLTFAAGYGPDDGFTGYTYTVDGSPATLKQRPTDGAYYLTFTKVYSNKLHLPHTITVSDGTDTITVNASVLSYAWVVLANNGTESTLVKAVYLYNRKALDKFPVNE